DYKSLRYGGLSLAVILFTLGILLILSDLVCRCSSAHSNKYNISADLSPMISIGSALEHASL
uniref:FXYD domain-containing ion transport regulator n=1 Tax=Nothobranchius furzeri TaxID=105023 RepID=A0A8C6M3F9_NOTFU